MSYKRYKICFTATTRKEMVNHIKNILSDFNKVTAKCGYVFLSKLVKRYSILDSIDKYQVTFTDDITITITKADMFFTLNIEINS